MASLDIVLSIKHPRCLTLECSLICIYPYFILCFFDIIPIKFGSKSIDFVLFSPKCILNFLSTSQQHISEKSTFNSFLIWLISLYNHINVLKLKIKT